MATERARIQAIVDTKANWNQINPILLNGEVGLEINPNGDSNFNMKIGDGMTAWNLLPYIAFSASAQTVATIALTQEEYDAMESHDPMTAYFVTDESGNVTQYLGDAKLSSGSSMAAGAATVMISGGVSDIGGDTRAATELLSGEIQLINAVRYPVNNVVGQQMLCEPRTVRCTTKEIYEIPAGKTATVSCAVSGMQITGWQMDDRFICTGNSFSTWQDFPLVIDNTSGSESMLVALNFRRSDNSDVSPSDFGTIMATLE